jgi:DNA-binding PadR family transcriptional regulator
MPRNALENPLVLPLLGLLIEQPGHPYELTQRLVDRYQHLKAQRSTVTTLVRRLAEAGLVKRHRRRRVARRPARTAYELTDVGYDHVRTRVAFGIVSARAGSRGFVLALAYIAVLPLSTAARLLKRRLAALHEEFRQASAQHSLPEYQMLEVTYWQQLLRAEIEWVQAFVERLEAGAIEWPRLPSSAEGK